MDISQIIAPRFLPQIAQTAPYVEDTNPPTANERQGLEYAIVSAIMNDPIAQVGYAPGVFQHGQRAPDSNGAGAYYPITGNRSDDRLFIQPQLYGNPQFPSIGAHEFRHRGYRQLTDAPESGTVSQPLLPEVADARANNPEGARTVDQLLAHPDREEHFNRMVDAAQGAQFQGNQSAGDYARRMSNAGLSRYMLPQSSVAPVQQFGETVVRALAERMLRNPQQRWGDW